MDQKFLEDIIEKLTNLKSDHDLLVRISTALESIVKANEEERERVAISIADVKRTADAAHVRIDAVVKFHYMTLGSVGTIAIVISVVLFVMKISGQG